jgi:hypothetical protein
LNGQPVTLLITNSIDYAADLLVKNLGSDNIFRYNTDLLKDFKLLVSDKTIEIEDPIGRRVTETDIVKVYRRSSMRASTIFPTVKLSDAERYDEDELWVALSDILNIFWEQGKVVLNQPLATLRSCKMQQMRIAAKFFDITPFRFVLGSEKYLRPGFQSVAKSFTFKFADGIGFYARKVDEGTLDVSHPWFLTDFIDADDDVTVVFVRDQLFAFSLDRKSFIAETIDWRKAPSTHAHRGWKAFQLPSAIEKAIFDFAAELGIHYARLDFLRKGSHYTFLEANYTGEWGWLDPDNTNGVMAKILYEIDPRTPVVGCPQPRWR